MHLLVKDLPKPIQRALNGYKRKDIDASVQDSLSMSYDADWSGGSRWSYTNVSLDDDCSASQPRAYSGFSVAHSGAQGGQDSITRPAGIATIRRSEGHHSFAWLLLHADDYAAMKPAVGIADFEAVAAQCKALFKADEKNGAPIADDYWEVHAGFSAKTLLAVSIVAHIRGGYRKDAFRRAGLKEYGATNPHVADAVSRGYLKANKAGAVSATTSGKNLPRMGDYSFNRW